MNNEKCQKVMEDFFLLDRGEHLPLKSSIHLLKCKNCRTRVRVLSKAEKIVSSKLNSQFTVNDEDFKSAVKNIEADFESKIKPVSFFNWIAIGVLILVFFVFTGLFIKESHQGTLIAFYLAFAVIISAYCALFVGMNMDFFIKKIDTSKLSF